MLRIDRKVGLLLDELGRSFDPVARTWAAASKAHDGEPADPVSAVAWLQRESGRPLRVPVGVIGPRDATPEQLRAAEDIGAKLAAMGLTIVCGGRQGVMEAVCRGAGANGGITVGLLPESDASNVNPYVTVPIATGIGEARNALVARSAFCLIAVGNSYGTLSEVALGLQFGKPVLGIAGAAEVSGIRHFEEVAQMIDAVAHVILGLAADFRP